MTWKWKVPSAALLALATATVVAPAAHAADVECTGDLGDQTISGDLVVPGGVDCVLGGATVEGDVVVNPDGWLDATSVTVGGDVVATDAYGVSLDGTSVAGDVSAYSADTRVGFLYLNDLTVGGDVAAGGVDVEINDSTLSGTLLTQEASYVDLLRTSVHGDATLDGSAYGVSVAGAVVGGTLTVSNGQRDLLVGATADGEADEWGNAVAGDLVLTDNAGNLRVAGTAVQGSIRTSGNDPAAAFGPGNTAGAVEGEHSGEEPGAAPEGDQAVAVTVPAQSGGELTWQLEGSSSLVDLGVATEELGYYQAMGQLVPVRVQDTRAGDPAWSVTGQVSDFVAGGQTVEGKYLGWTPGVLENGGDAIAGEHVASGFDAGEGLAQARTLARADEGHARGASVVGATLDLKLPLDTPRGTYTATITLTALG
ncbi:hypothetical protein [Cellulosimicrobium sp. Marseille-Q8652]